LTKVAEEAFTLAGRTFKIARHGVRAAIVDYGLSRLTVPGVGVLFTNFNGLPLTFQSFEGDDPTMRQVYRDMRPVTG
jgi:hypothetical protein